MAGRLRTSNGFVVFLGSLLALLLVGVILTWRIAVGPKPQDLDSKRANARLAAREKLDQEAHLALTSAGWVDKAKGVVRVPISELYAASAAELKAKGPRLSEVKVEAPIPLPPADPKSTEPPPMPLPSAPQGAETMHFVTPVAAVPPPAGAAANSQSSPK